MPALLRNWWPWAIVPGWFVLSFVAGIFRNQRRSQDVAAIARELGFTFTPWIGPGGAPRAETALFQNDPGASYKNVMAGKYAGLDVEVFDYACTTGSAQNSTTTTQTVAVYTQSIEFPAFAVAPKSFAGALLDAFQHQNVELNTPPDVTMHLSVHGSDKLAIQSFIDGRRMRVMESLNPKEPWHIEGAGKKLVLYCYGRRVQPAKLKNFLQETSAFAGSFCSASGAAAAR